MDNASKALIMAGAILISVAIVGIGIYIFSIAKDTVGTAGNSIDSMNIEIFNNGFYSYANHGDTILGTRAQSLLNYAKTQGIDIEGAPDKFESRKKYTVTYGTDGGSGAINKVNFAVYKGTTGS